MRLSKTTKKAGITCLLVLVALCSEGLSETTNGAEEIVLDGGNLGVVTFPHRRHQQDDPPGCERCHALFPQVENGIAIATREGKLEPRQVMNGLCIKCHKEAAEAGKPSGPRSCTVCHIKNGALPR